MTPRLPPISSPPVVAVQAPRLLDQVAQATLRRTVRTTGCAGLRSNLIRKTLRAYKGWSDHEQKQAGA